MIDPRQSDVEDYVQLSTPNGAVWIRPKAVDAILETQRTGETADGTKLAVRQIVTRGGAFIRISDTSDNLSALGL